MINSLFQDVPEGLFEEFPNENFEDIGQVTIRYSVYWRNFSTVPAGFALRSMSGRLYFSNVGARSIAHNAFQVERSNGRSWSVVTNWQITVSASSVPYNGNVLVSAFPPPNVSGRYRIVLRAHSLRQLLIAGTFPFSNIPSTHSHTAASV